MQILNHKSLVGIAKEQSVSYSECERGWTWHTIGAHNLGTNVFVDEFADVTQYTDTEFRLRIKENQ